MKPQLPPEIQAIFPREIVMLINSFVPHLKPTPDKSPYGCTVSPSMERDLRRIQNTVLKGKSEMWLKGLDDFVLR